MSGFEPKINTVAFSALSCVLKLGGRGLLLKELLKWLRVNKMFRSNSHLLVNRNPYIKAYNSTD